MLPPIARPLALAGATLAALTLPAVGQCTGGELRLEPPDGAPSDFFGAATSLAGDFAVVGSPLDDDACPGHPICQSGSAYVYRRAGASWVLAQKLAHADGSPLDFFGGSVAISGGWLAVGSRGQNAGAIDAGAVHVFELAGGAWVPSTVLQTSDPLPQQHLGTYLALSGDALLASAHNDPTLGDFAGAVYVFERGTSGWLETQKLLASDGEAFEYFGAGLHVAGQRAIVGAWGDDTPLPATGSAYVFERGPAGWNEVAKLIALDGGGGDQFGRAVAISGDVALVGAAWHDALGSDVGAAYVFERRAGSWVQTQKLLPPDPSHQHYFGGAVALDGDRALVGARYDDDGGWRAGAAYAYRRTAAGFVLDRKLLDPAAAPGDSFGSSLALAGGRALIGAPGDGTAGVAGAALLVSAAFQPALPYCRCATGAPCGNADPVAGCSNSGGYGAALSSCGSPGVSADDLVLTVASLPPGQFGLIYMGAESTLVPFGDGLRCVGAGGVGIFRFPARDSGPAGTITEGPGIAAHSQASFPAPGAIQPGATWYFQAWYRDPGGPCGSGFNLSNAAQVDFAP